MPANFNLIETIKRKIPRPYKMRWLAAAYNFVSLPKFRWKYGREKSNGRYPGRRILFYPDVPWKSSVMYQICLELGMRITNNPRNKFDVAIRWKNATFDQPGSILEKVSRSCQVINLSCNDISKQYVDAIFQEVFGYSSLVDPRTYHGDCVQKSNLNARHDGQIVQCPIDTPDEGSVYQVLIDNRVDEKKVVDYRVAVINGKISCVLIWYKPIHHRFASEIHKRELCEASDVFSGEEIEKILLVAKRMNLDYGEIDVLRNRVDGKIYIIDVNTTPDGPPLNEMHIPPNRASILRRAESFSAMVEGLFKDRQYLPSRGTKSLPTRR